MKHLKEFQLKENTKYLDLEDKPITKELIKNTIISELTEDFEYTDKVFSNPKVDELINEASDKLFRKFQDELTSYVNAHDIHGGSDYRRLQMYIDDII